MNQGQILLALFLWLHQLATVILIGYYGLIALIFLPAFSQDVKGGGLAKMVERVSLRTRNLILTSLVVFIFTGIYLMFADSNYQGFGEFGNLWGILMLTKHVLVLIMIGLGVFADRAVIPALSLPVKGKYATPPALKQLRTLVNITAILGVIVLLLTAAAQVI